MNPLVQEMLFAQHREDLELRNLEELLEDGCKCESMHTRTTCSGEVTYLISWCLGTRKVCKNTVDHPTLGTRAVSTHPCAGCGNLGSDCWTIRPI